jgi:fatty-acyl-CoA synthase
MIISGGENVASSEIERVISELPDMLEAAVIELPDPSGASVRWRSR